MIANKLVHQTALLAVFLMICIWGCSGKPFDPPTPGEIPKGPGIISKGDEGAVLYDSKKGNVKPAAAERTAPQAPASDGDLPSASTYEEFEAYKQWLELKKSQSGNQEYEEFRQWREWRQYQLWKNSN